MKRALDLESEDLYEVPTLMLTSHAYMGSPKHPFAHVQDQEIGLYGLLCLMMLKKEEGFYKRESLIHWHLTQTLSSLWLESDTDAWWPNKPLQRSAASITLRWRVHCRKGEEKQTVRIIFSSLTITSIVTTAGFKQRDHMVILDFWFSNLAAH